MSTISMLTSSPIPVTDPTTTTVSSNVNLDEPSTSRYDQCDYNLLFSHLPASFAHLSQIQLSQLSLHVVGSGSGSLPPPPPITTDQHAVQKLCYALVALCFGLFYSLIGYRFLKLSAFIMGFALGSSIIYMILAEQKQLTVVENLIISLSIGCLFAFVALLVQYIGLFLLGITASISIVTCILIVIDLFHTNQSAWLCILLMFSCATLVASITLKFQKSLTIFNTSAIGAGLLLFALDYFVENNLLIDYIFELYRVNGNAFNIFERQKALLKPSLSSSDKTTTSTTTRLLALTTKTTSSFSLANATSITNRAANSSEPATNSALALFLHLYSSAHARLCWYTWLIFGIYFVFLISSILVQYCITGKNYDHRDSWQKLIRGSRKKRSANLEKIRLKSHVSHESADHHHHHGGGGHHHHHHHHSRHHHHHHRHHSKSTPPPQSSSNTATSSGTNTDRLSLSAQSIDSQNNDTLLLVTNELHPPREYQGKSGASRHVKQSSAKVVKQHHVRSSKAAKNTAADLQIVSFEVIKSPKSKDKERHREKTTTSTAIVTTKTENSNKTAAAALPSTKPSSSSSKQSSSISTTTSSSSSASSTCQLIPVHLVLDPSAPPAPSSSSSSSSENQQQQQPPPVPSQPPPKLPPMFAAAAVATSTATITSNGATVSSLQASMAKMKQHRSGNSGSAKKSDSSGDKFRHFYQIRRNNGDVLSQDFLNNFHSTKIHSTSNLNTNESATDSASNAPLTSSLNSSDNSKKKRRSLSSKSKS